MRKTRRTNVKDTTQLAKDTLADFTKKDLAGGDLRSDLSEKPAFLNTPTQLEGLRRPDEKNAPVPASHSVQW